MGSRAEEGLVCHAPGAWTGLRAADLWLKRRIFSLHELGIKSWNKKKQVMEDGKSARRGRLEGEVEALRVMTELTR